MFQLSKYWLHAKKQTHRFSTKRSRREGYCIFLRLVIDSSSIPRTRWLPQGSEAQTRCVDVLKTNIGRAMIAWFRGISSGTLPTYTTAVIHDQT
jgi:hypothetical protein